MYCSIWKSRFSPPKKVSAAKNLDIPARFHLQDIEGYGHGESVPLSYTGTLEKRHLDPSPGSLERPENVTEI